jgi:predicted short-subunit dehydrogenase-like oxidoreductase (DUF2520 family)
VADASGRTPDPLAPGRLGVGVVGAGRVGTVLAAALAGAGHSVVGASAVSRGSVERLEAMLPGVPRLDPPEVVRRAELVLLTVPDDVLPGLVRGLAAVGAWQPGQLVVHTSGRFGVGVLAPAVSVGAIALAVHPAMTFTGTTLDLARLPGCAMAVTAAGPVLPIAQALVLEMGSEPVVVAEDARPVYHAALAHVANHLVTLVAQGLDILTAAGVDRPDRVLGPLAAAALDNAVRTGDAALTGPVSRGDAGTVADHLRALRAAEAGSGTTATYRALATATVERAARAGRITGEDRARLLRALLAVDGADGPGGPASSAGLQP